ncbi:hypothetical protein Dimus_035683 [Dionaea muscipula]
MRLKSWAHIFVHGEGNDCMVEYQARLQGPPAARMGIPQARTHAVARLDGGARFPSVGRMMPFKSKDGIGPSVPEEQTAQQLEYEDMTSIMGDAEEGMVG